MLFFLFKGRYFSVSLNEEILRRGLGKTVLVKGLDYDSKIYWTIHRNLLKAELTALKKGEGIWKEEYEKESYLEKFKGSWREIWKKDSYLKKIGSDFNLRKESYYDKFRRTYETWKDNINNYSLILKFRELMNRIYFRRKGWNIQRDLEVTYSEKSKLCKYMDVFHWVEMEIPPNDQSCILMVFKYLGDDYFKCHIKIT